MVRNTQVHTHSYLSQPALLPLLLAANAVKLCEVCLTPLAPLAPLVLTGGPWGRPGLRRRTLSSSRATLAD